MSNIAYAVPCYNGINKAEKYFANVDPKTKAFEATDSVVTMAVTPHDQMWVVLQNGGIEVRNVHSGHVVHSYAPAKRPTKASRIWCALPVVTAGPSGSSTTQMWLGLSSGTIEVHNAESFELIRQLHKHISGVYCLAHNSSMKCVFSGSSDFHIAQWRVTDGRLLRVISGHSNYIRCLFSERAALVSGSDDGTIRVWNASSGDLLYTALFHKKTDLAASKENHTNERSAPAQRRLSGNTEQGESETNGVSALCRIGMTMWSGDNKGTLAIWKLQDGSPLLVSRPHEQRITSIQKVGSRVYTSSADGTIGVHNALDGTLVQTLRDHAGSRVVDVRCAVELDRYYVWTGAADNTVRCWHHDEHIPMTSERESFNDMRWYYATQRPYEGANKKLLDEQKELTELCMLTIGSTEAVQDFIDDTDEKQQTGAMQYYVMENKLRELQKNTNEAEEKKKTLEKNILEKKQQLEEMRQNYQRVSEQLNQARIRQQNAYLYGYGGYNPYGTTSAYPSLGQPLGTDYNAPPPLAPAPPPVVSVPGGFATTETSSAPPPLSTLNEPPLPKADTLFSGAPPPKLGAPIVTLSSSVGPDLTKMPPPPPPPVRKSLPLTVEVFGVTQKTVSSAEKPPERRSSFTLGTGGSNKPLGGRRLSF
ncbi:WD domain, G-beta repeat, putative [Angomonas deanei]|uniref:WD domain, G-beta repeat, putative n=1 Tax=Angomonas deanei TaxID=59799 RepID=A0A7G2CFC6_9TRYP|nr:WD domain, G-beta repeat, putative [Angomonas deanei]